MVPLMLTTYWSTCARLSTELRICSLRCTQLETCCFRLLFCFSFAVVKCLQRWCLVFWDYSWHTKLLFHLNTISCGAGQMLEDVAQKSCGAFILKEAQNPARHNPEQLVLPELDWTVSKVPSPSHSDFGPLWFHYIIQFADEWVKEHMNGNSRTGAIRSTSVALVVTESLIFNGLRRSAIPGLLVGNRHNAKEAFRWPVFPGFRS